MRIISNIFFWFGKKPKNDKVDKDPFEYLTMRFDYNTGFPKIIFVDFTIGKN